MDIVRRLLGIWLSVVLLVLGVLYTLGQSWAGTVGMLLIACIVTAALAPLLGHHANGRWWPRR